MLAGAVGRLCVAPLRTSGCSAVAHKAKRPRFARHGHTRSKRSKSTGVLPCGQGLTSIVLSRSRSHFAEAKRSLTAQDARTHYNMYVHRSAGSVAPLRCVLTRTETGRRSNRPPEKCVPRKSRPPPCRRRQEAVSASCSPSYVCSRSSERLPGKHLKGLPTEIHDNYTGGNKKCQSCEPFF